MAGTSAQLITKLSCKLHVERDGVSLLSPSCAKTRFVFSLRSDNGRSLAQITPTSDSIRLPASPFFPQRFDLRLVKQVSTKFAAQGKLTLSLINYNSACPDCTMYKNPPATTLVQIAEAAPEAIQAVIDYLTGKPVKRTAEGEDCVEKRQKVECRSPLESIPADVFSLVIDMVGEPLKKFRLINRWFRKNVCFHVKKLKILDAEMATGAMISKLVKRTIALRELDLEDCRDFTFTVIHQAQFYPLKKLQILNLSNCKGLNTNGVLLLLKMSPLLESLNLLGCYLENKLLDTLKPKLELKEVKEIAMSGFEGNALADFFGKYRTLVKIRLEDVYLSEELLSSLSQLPSLLSLSITYTECLSIISLPAWSGRALESISILPASKFPRSNPRLGVFWATLDSLSPKEVALDAPLATLPQSLIASIEKLISTSLPMFDLPSLRDLTVFIDGNEMMEFLSSPAAAALQPVEKLLIVLNSDWQKPMIDAELRRRFPACTVAFRIVSLR